VLRHSEAWHKAKRTFLAEEAARTIRLGAGSVHAGTTGEVMLQFEGFLLAGDPHSRGIIWDLSVNEKEGELYVLSDPRPSRAVPNVQVFDRRGKYLRTIMPLNPNLPRSSVQDLCRKMAREGEAELVIPKLFEDSTGVLSMYGAYWNVPQKMAVAPNGDLIMSNIMRGTLMRMRPDGSLPPEGWTSVYHRGRNEPFESTRWVVDSWWAKDLKNYLPFGQFHYPYFCFDKDGHLYVSAGQAYYATRVAASDWEVDVAPRKGGMYGWGKRADWEAGTALEKGAEVWKYRLDAGVKVENKGHVAGFAGPCGLVFDGDHLIVADSGNNRLQVSEDGHLVTSITQYEHEEKKTPLVRLIEFQNGCNDVWNHKLGSLAS